MRFWILGMLLAVTCAAQDVPPPPKAADAAPSVEAQMKSLQDKINSIGQVNWNWSTRNTNTGEVMGPKPVSVVTALDLRPRTCEMKIQIKWSTGSPSEASYFLEELDKIDVGSFQDQMTQYFVLQGHPEIQYSVSPTLYTVMFNGDFRNTVRVADQQTANQIADGLRQVAQSCMAIPPAPPNSGPSMEETLGFIADKVNAQGAVSFLTTVQNTAAGTSGAPSKGSEQISAATGDTRTGILKYHMKNLAGDKTVSDSDLQLSFRRISKISVATHQEALTASLARGGHPELSVVISPEFYDLAVTDTAGGMLYFPFTDQDLANRVAKAMLHASELCGAGNNEPF